MASIIDCYERSLGQSATFSRFGLDAAMRRHGAIPKIQDRLYAGFQRCIILRPRSRRMTGIRPSPASLSRRLKPTLALSAPLSEISTAIRWSTTRTRLGYGTPSTKFSAGTTQEVVGRPTEIFSGNGRVYTAGASPVAHARTANNRSRQKPTLSYPSHPRKEV